MNMSENYLLINQPTRGSNLSSSVFCFFVLSTSSTNLYLALNLGYHWVYAWHLEVVCALSNFLLYLCHLVFSAINSWKNNWIKVLYTKKPFRNKIHTECINWPLLILRPRGHRQRKWINMVIQFPLFVSSWPRYQDKLYAKWSFQSIFLMYAK